MGWTDNSFDDVAMNTKALTAVFIVFFFMFSALSILGPQGVIGSSSSNPVDTMMNITFTVDPEGWVTIDGMINNTTSTTVSPNFTMYGDLSVIENGLTTNITLLLPPENATNFPFNSSAASILMEYAEGLLDTDMNFTMTLPSKEVLSENIPDVDALDMLEYFLNSTDFILDANYEDGDVDVNIHYTMAANLTDLIGSMMDMTLGFEAPFTIDLDYSQGEYDGAVRAYLLPGFPVSDVEIDLTGNLTDVCFNGTIPVIYGNYFDMEINSTFLESIQYFAETVFNASIDQEGSLLNMTQGAMECTDVRVEIDPIADTGALVTFRVCVRAEDGFLWVPLLETPPTDFETTWLYLTLNNTLYEMQDADIHLVYTPADTTLDLTVDGAIHFRDLVARLLDPMAIPDEWQGGELPPELNSTNLPCVWLAMEILNTTIHSVEDASLHVAYSRGDRSVEMNFATSIELEGLYENLSTLISELTPEQEECLASQDLPDLTQLFESTSPIGFADIKGLQASVTYAKGKANLLVTQTFEGSLNAELNDLKGEFVNYLIETPTETPQWQVLYLNDTEIDLIGMRGWVRMDNVSTGANFTGITIKPPIDTINATAFTLDRFFNLTADEPFPEHGEQLNVTILGGRNATHKVTMYNPTSVPDLDQVLFDADDKPVLMAWNNVSLLDLRDLQFIISARTLLAVTLNTPTPDNITETSISLSWTESEDPDFVRYELFQSPSSGVLGTSIANITDSENTIYEIQDLAPGTSYYFTVRIVDSFGLNADSNQVSATTLQPIWAQTWFIAAIVGVIAVLTGAIYYGLRKSSNK